METISIFFEEDSDVAQYIQQEFDTNYVWATTDIQKCDNELFSYEEKSRELNQRKNPS